MIRRLGRSNSTRRRWFGCTGLLFFSTVVVAVQSPLGPFVEGVSAVEDTIVIDLAERNDSGVTGQAEITANDAESRIRVSVAGGDGEYLPYLHRGTCNAFNDSISVPLSLATYENPSETTVDLDLETLIAGDVVLDLHLAEGSLESLMDPATSVACGTIVAAAAGGSDVVTQAPIAGIGPFDVREGRSAPALLLLSGTGVIAALAGLRAGRISRPIEPVLIDVVAMRRLRGLFP